MMSFNGNIAILGASSHIAKWLVCNYAGRGVRLHLFSRQTPKLGELLPVDLPELCSHGRCVIHDNYERFAENQYDVIINCIGPGVFSGGVGNYADFFVLTEKYDNLVIDYLERRNRQALYICFSSGAVYGRDMASPAALNSVNKIAVNRIQPIDYHLISRINSEAKHRAYNGLNIVDIRIFSYFSRYADLSEKYLIAEVVNSIVSSNIFITGREDVIRDYVHPDDLCQLVDQCMALGQVNRCYDAYSGGATTKFNILDRFSAEFGLKYEIGVLPAPEGGTGHKRVYCSAYHAAASIGYQPKYSSIDALVTETRHLLADRGIPVRIPGPDKET